MCDWVSVVAVGERGEKEDLRLVHRLFFVSALAGWWPAKREVDHAEGRETSTRRETKRGKSSFLPLVMISVNCRSSLLKHCSSFVLARTESEDRVASLLISKSSIVAWNGGSATNGDKRRSIHRKDT